MANVVDVERVIDPETPEIVSEMAIEAAAGVVCIVRIEVPWPTIEDGLNPAFETPAGKPVLVATLKFTVPLKPDRGVTVTVNCAA